MIKLTKHDVRTGNLVWLQKNLIRLKFSNFATGKNIIEAVGLDDSTLEFLDFLPAGEVDGFPCYAHERGFLLTRKADGLYLYEEGRQVVMVPVGYAHQLQNLIHALTGQDI